ncbi:MAG TPA: pilus assembly protein PilM, partial [Myxococcota bacterium]
LWEGLLAGHDVDAGPTSMGDLRTAGGTVIEVAEGAPAPAVAIVDVGHRRTSVCILRDGRVVSAHTLLHGGADATRALAKEIGLSLDEAERGKRKEAFLEVEGAVAQFPEQRQISDVLKKAHTPLIRRLRQLFQASISTSRLRIVKVVLTGGGGKVLNFDRHLAEQLNIKVVRGRELSVLARAAKKSAAVDDVGDSAWSEYALAMSYALAGFGGARATRIDFRVGPFAWKGDYDFLRERLPALGAWAAALLLVVGIGSVAQMVMLSREEDALLQRQLTLCEQITGDKIDSTSRCIALIQERINGTGGFTVPEHSAVDTFMEVSRRLPYSEELKRKITELDITDERVRLKGTTTTYEAIDTVVSRLQGGACFQLVEKGKARNINADTVEMNVTINLDCAQAPGDGKVIPPPAGPTAAALAAQAASTTPPSSTSSSPTKQDVLIPPPPDEPPPDGDASRPASKSSPEQIEARKERLKRLREEREKRRQQLLETPGSRGSMRERFNKTMPMRGLDATDDANAEGDE